MEGSLKVRANRSIGRVYFFRKTGSNSTNPICGINAADIDNMIQALTEAKDFLSPGPVKDVRDWNF